MQPHTHTTPVNQSLAFKTSRLALLVGLATACFAPSLVGCASHHASGCEDCQCTLADTDLAKLDLKNNPAAYSLQVGYFDKQSGNNYRMIAENKAKALRSEGYEAYFYHSSDLRISIVLVGQFHKSDLIKSGQGMIEYGSNIRKLQAHFPNNSENGKVTPSQPSLIVSVPKENG